MCGIAGILHVDDGSVIPEQVTTMTETLSHRGPDGVGIECQGPWGLGHRRLSIIDLEGGRQPLANEDGSIWITFNGEIYNYRELRKSLVAAGHEFRTQSDTEVIVHAYEEWGRDCVERLRGMFAFAIVDTRQQQLFLARDHLGIKPLFYCLVNGRFIFASELQAIRILCIPLDLDHQAIDQYLCLQYIPPPRTAFRQIQQLPPAHHLTIPFTQQTLPSPVDYWDVTFQANESRPVEEWLDELDAVLSESVRAHLVADVPFGAFLSGGLDSSAVVAHMAKELGDKVRTFTIGFEDDENADLPYAQQVAEQFHTAHHVEMVRPDALAILPELVKHYGEPFGDSSAVPTYYVSKLAREHVPMVLSGDGADEAFSGYGSHQRWLSWLAMDDVTGWKRTLYPLAQQIMPRRYERPAQAANWLEFVNQTTAATRNKLWRPEFHDHCNLPIAAFHDCFERAAAMPPGSKARYVDLKTYMPSAILTKVDRASMMHGLEVRTPLVDIKVVEFAATVPDELTMVRDASGNYEGKALLKQVMARHFPDAFLKRPKRGFSAPLHKWFGHGGQAHGDVKERLGDHNSPLRDCFRPDAIQDLIRQEDSRPIWLLLFLDEWLRQLRSLP